VELAESVAGQPNVLGIVPGIGSGAHAVEKWVDLASVNTCAEVYLAAAVKFCG